MRNIIKSFQILKCNTVIDEFVYSRRGNTYEIYNNSGCLYSGCSYAESQEMWKDLVKGNKVMKKFGFIVRYV